MDGNFILSYIGQTSLSINNSDSITPEPKVEVRRLKLELGLNPADGCLVIKSVADLAMQVLFLGQEIDHESFYTVGGPNFLALCS